MKKNLFTVDIRSENDVVLARQKARIIAAALKFDPQDQIRIATAVSEIARNTLQYAGSGRAEFAIDDQPENTLVITFRDQGKGISNLDEILSGKYVSHTGMGVGLIGAKRLMDQFHIETAAGRGTTIVIGKRIPLAFKSFANGQLEKVLTAIERAPQDAYEELKHQNKELLNTLEELRMRQEELAQLNRELDETNRGVVALYAELNEKADFLQRASELKSHFLSNMGHEFRTPLNSIAALTQILLDRLDGELTTEQEKQVSFIRSSAQDLVELVNDLLDLAKVEAGKVVVRPGHFKVESLFAALRGMLRPLLIQNSSVNLIFDDPVDISEMYSDEGKISQILRNFISNALKFTERGEIRVSVKRGPDDVAIFSVADTGIGIAENDQEHIFQEWTQIEGELQRSVKGSGLGLPLSRRFAQLLGGNVSVQSRLGLGSTFFAHIPITYEEEQELVYVPPVKREFDANRAPVLVVEDNLETLFIYDKYLSGTQFQIIPAKNLKEARNALREFKPAAIVLDVLLQGEHAWGWLEELKSNRETKNIPVVVVTVIENREKALQLGANAFHSKPIDKAWLIRQLDRVIVHESARRVLIVDDDEVSRYLLKSLLGTKGLLFTEASSGGQGLETASATRPDIIILDLGLDDLSGFEVLRKLKEDSVTAGIPVLIYTSKVLDEIELGRLSGAVAVLSKESESRELSLQRFSEAFDRAGVPLTVRVAREANHV
jgi:signal transduction histidine kinase/CheY-like chemotaxis protein